MGGKRGCPDIGKAEDVEGEARWSVPDSAACFLSSFTSLSVGWVESSSISSPEKEKLNADMLILGFSCDDGELLHVRVKISRDGWRGGERGNLGEKVEKIQPLQ